MSKKGVATAATFRAVTRGRAKAGFNLDTPSGIQDALTTLAVRCSKDPLRFVQLAFPWGKGTLEKYTGPDTWQTEILTAMRDRLQSGHEREEVYQDATAAGHGCGKSGLVAWLVLWALCTYPDTRGVVTANTETQLRTKTFAEVAKWYNVCLFKDWFTCSAMSIYSKQPGHDKTWRIDAIPWSETNPEAFAGLHNAGARTLVIFDEASAISNVIWEVTEGALTDKDTEKFWLCFGNPTRNTGRFFDCFNRFRHRWVHRHIDTRNAVMSDKTQIQKWIDDYGEDSDFVKVRVRGVFPSSSNMQFISRDVVDTAAQRESEHQSIIDTVCILGVDVARFGDDRSVIFCRVGMDARSWKHREYRGLDGWQLGAKVAEFYNDLVSAGARRVVINIDAGGVGSSPLDWLRKNGYEVNGINFGESPSRKDLYANKRAEMWARGREWLKAGGQIENSDDLITDLTGVEFDYTPKNLLLLEKKEDMKKRGLSSPDLADALMLTLAVPMNEYLADIQPVTPYRNNRRAETRDPYA